MATLHNRIATIFHLIDLSEAINARDDLRSNLQLLREELAPLIESLKSREKCEEGKHSFTPITNTGWRWCIRCGRLRAGNSVFTPGPHQVRSIKPDV